MNRRHFLLAAVAMIMAFSTGCRKYGRRVKFGKMEVFYKKPVTREMAEKLGEFILREKLATRDRRTSFQLVKPDGRLQFRMVVREGVEEDKSIHLHLRLLVQKMSEELFAGAPVDMHLCDKKLKSLVEYPYTPIHLLKIQGSTLIYESPISEKTAKNLSNFLIKEKFFSKGRDVAVHLIEEKGRVKFRYTVMAKFENDAKYLEAVGTFQKQLSKAIFGGKPVDIVFITDKLEVKKEITFQ